MLPSSCQISYFHSSILLVTPAEMIWFKYIYILLETLRHTVRLSSIVIITSVCKSFCYPVSIVKYSLIHYILTVLIIPANLLKTLMKSFIHTTKVFFIEVTLKLSTEGSLKKSQIFQKITKKGWEGYLEISILVKTNQSLNQVSF